MRKLWKLLHSCKTRAVVGIVIFYFTAPCLATVQIECRGAQR